VEEDFPRQHPRTIARALEAHFQQISNNPYQIGIQRRSLRRAIIIKGISALEREGASVQQGILVGISIADHQLQLVAPCPGDVGESAPELHLPHLMAMRMQRLLTKHCVLATHSAITMDAKFVSGQCSKTKEGKEGTEGLGRTGRNQPSKVAQNIRPRQ